MSAPQKRGRACDNCHDIKIKCGLSETGEGPPCERCVRLTKDCTITPTKKQKDRVAELEAQVEALTRLLMAQGIGQRDELSPDSNRSGSSAPRKRRRHNAAQPVGIVAVGNPATASLDQIVPVCMQQKLLEKYRTDMVPCFPIVPIPEHCDLEVMRSTRPALLHAIVYAACPGLLSQDAQEEVAALLMANTPHSIITTLEPGLELVQVLHISSSWYWIPRRHKHLAAFQFIDHAYDAAVEAGLDDNGMNPGPAEQECHPIVDVWRAWIVCHMLSASLAAFLRRQKKPVWTSNHEKCLGLLRYSPFALPSDDLLCQYVRAERICEQVIEKQELLDGTRAVDITDAIVQDNMRTLQNQITDWKTQIPASLKRPMLLLWQHIATLYLHEPVLHTQTNKHSFAAPYIAENLSVTDFPAPLVAPEHITSLVAVRVACHAIIDIYCDIPINIMMSLPGKMYPARLMYAIYILTKAYIATTAQGNTFGAFLDPSDLQVEAKLAKIADLRHKVVEQDQCSGSQTIILHSIERISDWFDSYKSMLREAQDTTDMRDWQPAIPDLRMPEDLSYTDWDSFFSMPADLSNVPGDDAQDDLQTSSLFALDGRDDMQQSSDALLGSDWNLPSAAGLSNI